jgi:hypothetical protein
MDDTLRTFSSQEGTLMTLLMTDESLVVFF